MKNKQERVERQKVLAKKIFPFVENLKTIYDAQTVFSALAGFIKFGLEKEEAKLRIEDVSMDFSKEGESAVKTAVIEIRELIRLENAKEAMSLLEIMGNKIPEFIANKHMKDSMKELTVEEFIA